MYSISQIDFRMDLFFFNQMWQNFDDFLCVWKVYSQGKNHALYLWIYVKPEANAKEVAKAVAKLQKYVDQVTDPNMKDEEDEIWAGVGFGPNFYKQVRLP